MTITKELTDGMNPDFIIGKADIVAPINGRDAGKYFIVVATEEEYSLIADGKGRKINKPKKKKNKHLKLEDKVVGSIAEKLIIGDNVTNNELKRALASYIAARSEQGVC
jgi:ribosomal protein L14E/L6E/L27E